MEGDGWWICCLWWPKKRTKEYFETLKPMCDEKSWKQISLREPFGKPLHTVAGSWKKLINHQPFMPASNPTSHKFRRFFVFFWKNICLSWYKFAESETLSSISIHVLTNDWQTLLYVSRLSVHRYACHCRVIDPKRSSMLCLLPIPLDLLVFYFQSTSLKKYIHYLL